MRLYIEKKSVRADGTCCIRVYEQINRKSIRVSTGLYVKPEYWDAFAQRVKGGKDAKMLNNALSAIANRVSSAIFNAKASGKVAEIDNDFITAAIEGRDLSRKDDLIEFIYRLAKTKKKEKTMNSYVCLARRIEKMACCISIEDVDRKFMQEFLDSLEGLKPNTKLQYMRVLKSTIRVAIDDGFQINPNYRTIKLKLQETMKRSLTIEKVRAIYNATYKRINLQIARDLFILVVFLRGINLSDLFSLTEDNIVDGRIVYNRKKTGKLYSVKIEPEAQELIDKYKSGRYLFHPYEKQKKVTDIICSKMKMLHYTSGDKSGEIIEPKMTLYWARHTWATLAYELDIPRDVISEGLGHSFGAAVTGVYIRTNDKKVDAANRKVIDYILQCQR